MKTVFLLFIFFFSNASAEPCEFSKLDPAEASSENFQIKTPKVEILFLSTFSSKPSQREAAYRIFFDEALSTADIVARIAPIYAGDKDAMTNLGSTALYLEDHLLDTGIKFVLVNLPPGEFRELNRAALALNLLEFEFRVKQNPELIDHLRALILDTVGVGPYLHARSPDLFRDIEYDSYSFDDSSRKKKSRNDDRPSSDPSHSTARSEERYNELLEIFRRSPRTRAMFIHYARKVKGDSYEGWSKADIEDEVTRHFWRPARAKIVSWIDLTISESKRNSDSPAPSKLLDRSGKGIVLLPLDGFKTFEDRFKKQCQGK